MKRLLALTLVFLLSLFICACEKDREEETTDETTTTVAEVTKETLPCDNDYKNADEYFHKNTTVHSEFTAEEAENIRTESEAFINLQSRGFTTFSILAEYDMEGVITQGYEISPDSQEKHPMYQTYYVTATGDTWMILEINGVIMANPLSYNQYAKKIIVLSETDTITSYDNSLNKFYVNIPKEGVTQVKKVDRISAEVLETLTADELSKL